MSSVPEAAAAVTAPAAEETGSLWRKILTVAWMSIGLGVLIELLLVLAAALTAKVPSGAAVVADAGQKVSWAFLVCAGLAFGTAAAKALRPMVMGALGLICAPLAFIAARAAHKGLLQTLGLVSVAGGASPVLIALLKGFEYASLGLLIGRWSKQGLGMKAYIGTGVAMGLTFGTLITVILTQAAPSSATFATILPRAINEVLFPVGCSFVLYAAEALAKRVPS